MRIIISIIAAAVLSLAATPVPAQPPAPSYEQLRNWCYTDSTDDESLLGCDAVIAAEREPPQGLAAAYFNRGKSYEYKNEPKRAIEDYGQAIRLMPTAYPAFYARGN